MDKELLENMFKEIQYSLKEGIGERINGTNILLFIVMIILILK